VLVQGDVTLSGEVGKIDAGSSRKRVRRLRLGFFGLDDLGGIGLMG
jgi:hypothetical protein